VGHSVPIALAELLRQYCRKLQSCMDNSVLRVICHIEGNSSALEFGSDFGYFVAEQVLDG
jgi:hypothetical protein